MSHAQEAPILLLFFKTAFFIGQEEGERVKKLRCAPRLVAHARNVDFYPVPRTSDFQIQGKAESKVRSHDVCVRRSVALARSTDRALAAQTIIIVVEEGQKAM